MVKFWNRLDAVSAHTSADDVQYATEISKVRPPNTLIRGSFGGEQAASRQWKTCIQAHD